MELRTKAPHCSYQLAHHGIRNIRGVLGALCFLLGRRLLPASPKCASCGRDHYPEVRNAAICNQSLFICTQCLPGGNKKLFSDERRGDLAGRVTRISTL